MKDCFQLDAPLYRAARAFLKRDYISLHVPLHGRGAGAPHLMRSGLAPLLRWDLTEVENLDDLHLPAGALRRAQSLAARLFGAGQTFFLVNGVTAGLLALLLALIRPGEKVLLSRLVHKAVIHGLVLCGGVPVYLPVEREPLSGFPLNVSVPAVEGGIAAASRCPPPCNYFTLLLGSGGQLADMARLARQHGVFFAVDEAHGGHLPFYGDLPHSAAAGADCWLHSAHKSLGALTPGAFFHLASGRAAPELRFWLQVLQTSSPSYPVMISLDLARRQAALKGRSLFRRSRCWAQCLRRCLQEAGLQLLSEAAVRHAGFTLDPARITLFLPAGGGMLLAKRLARNSRLQVEMAGENYILALCGPAQLALSPRALARAIAGVARTVTSGVAVSAEQPPFCFARSGAASGNLKPFPLAPREAVSAAHLFMPLEESAGMLCAEPVVLAPPGIPLLAPGERINEALLAVLLQLRAGGCRFQGAADPALGRIKVVNNS